MRQTKHILILLLLLLSSNSFINAQTSEQAIKATLVYYFMQYVNWPNDSILKNYTVGIIGNDKEIVNEFLTISKIKTIKQKPIILKTITQINDLNNIQVLYIDEVLNQNISDLYKIISHKNVLLITYNATNKLNSMINLLKKENDSKITYETNKQLLKSEGFTYKNELLLYGGSQMDVKEILDEADKKLANVLEEIKKHDDRIKEKEIEVANKNSIIEEQQIKIATYIKNLENQQKIYTNVINQINKKQTILNDKNNEILIQKSQKNLIISEIKKKQIELAKSKKSLQNILIELDNKRKENFEKDREIEEKKLKISNQQKQLYITILTLIAVTIIGSGIFLLYRLKKQLSSLLEKKVEERTKELNDSKDHLKNLFENTPVATIEFDFTQVIVFINSLNIKNEEEFDLIFDKNENLDICIKLTKVNDLNEEAIKLFEYPDKETLVKNFHEIHIKGQRNDIKQSFKMAWKKEHSFTYETQRITFNQSIRHIIIRWVKESAIDDYSKVLYTMTDITKIKEYENELKNHRDNLEKLVEKRTSEIYSLNQELLTSNEELYATNEQLYDNKNELENSLKQLKEMQDQLIQSEKLASLGMLTAGIAHEINNPINFISSGRQLLIALLDDLKKHLDMNSPEIQEIFENLLFIDLGIKTGVERTSEIVSSLKNYVRFETETFIETNIIESMHDALLILKNNYKNNITIHETYDGNFVIKCIPGKIYQLFVNLLSNAIDAIEKKGDIYINFERNETKDITIKITDTGHGIEENKLQKIFDPFFTTKEVGKGTGLGLYIVYGIVQQHNGNISVNSKIGEGTTFVITLPINQEQLI